MRLSRAKGYRKPHGAVVVSRPSRWGNPFPMEGDRAAAVAAFTAGLERRRRGRLGPEEAMAAYPPDDEIRLALRGRDLACWCPLDGPCHADVLLRIANS